MIQFAFNKATDYCAEGALEKELVRRPEAQDGGLNQMAVVDTG